MYEIVVAIRKRWKDMVIFFITTGALLSRRATWLLRQACYYLVGQVSILPDDIIITSGNLINTSDDIIITTGKLLSCRSSKYLVGRHTFHVGQLIYHARWLNYFTRWLDYQIGWVIISLSSFDRKTLERMHDLAERIEETNSNLFSFRFAISGYRFHSRVWPQHIR